MTTGLTPLLDSLIAGGYVKLFYDFRRGSLIDSSTSAVTLTTPASALLQRNGVFIQGSIASATTSAYLLTSSLINIFVKLIPYKIPASSTIGIPFCNIWGDNGFQFYTANAAGQAIRFQVGYGTGNVLHIGSGTPLTMNFSQTISAQIKSNNADGIVLYKNGSRLPGTISMAGKTFVGNNNSYKIGNGGSTSNLVDGIYQVILVIEGIPLSDSQHLEMCDELDNQIRYETQDCFWPVSSTVYWRGAFGALADETATAAGRSIGGINELVVASGTHKMSTEKLDGILTKCLVCVTNGTINLPAYNLGANYVFEKYTASTGLWTTVTQASRAVALLAGDKILWANQTGNRYIKRIY